MKKLCLAALAAVSLLGCSDTKEEEKTTEKAAEPVRGVTDTEIKLGGMHDLSGVFAAFSAPAVQVANDMFDEVNAEGGIHGRKIPICSRFPSHRRSASPCRSNHFAPAGGAIFDLASSSRT